ncbi:MAG: type II toxin-antitoxin system RelE/ParE family toxin [Burkholderiaceae bacterium]|nr:type II toxin-antitoxin system RelE/ParE family toxin [Burkholderiaceae bacterium]
MTGSLQVVRTPRYEADLVAIGEYIARHNTDAAYDMLVLLESQVDQLADPNFPRRTGRVPGTLELVAHPNYIVLLEQTDTTVTALALMHVARRYP